MSKVAFDLDRLARAGRKHGPEDADSPGKAVNNDGAHAMGGSYGAGSLFASLGLDEGPAVSALETAGGGGGGGDVSTSLAASPATKPVHGAESPTKVAEAGFTGEAKTLPFKSELEKQFGVPLDGVETFSDEKAAHANSQLGSAAYASGHRIAFATPNPQMSLVAHELTHVLQHTGTGHAAKGGGGGGGGVDTSGEGEAERVEKAVAAGRSTKSALDTDPRRPPAAGGKGPGPALKQAGQRPALSSPFSSGLTFSPTGLEQSMSYRIWEGHGIRAPIAAVPGLFMTLSPEVTASVSGGVDWSKNVVTSQLGINGGVAAGLSYGDPHLAEIYGNMEAMASGRFRYERGRAPGPEEGNHGAGGGHAEPHSHGATGGRNDNWTLDGAISLETSFNVGVKLGGGIIDKRFQFGRCEIGALTGLSWRNGHFERERVGWEWGPMPQRFFREVNALIRRAQQIMRMPQEAAQAAWHGVATSAGAVYHGAGNVLHALNPFG